MVLAEFAIFPLDKGESLSRHVAPMIDTIDRSGLAYRLTPMGTIVEGDWDEVLSVVSRCFKRMRKSSGRITLSLRVDYRKGRRGAMQGKVKSIEAKIGRSICR